MHLGRQVPKIVPNFINWPLNRGDKHHLEILTKARKSHHMVPEFQGGNSGMKVITAETIAGILARILAAAAFWALVLAQIPAAAETGNPTPSEIVAQGFEDLLGHELDNSQMSQLESALAKLAKVEETRARETSLVGKAVEMWERYEKLPLVCLYGKGNIKMPAILGKFTVHNLSASYEFTPCLLLNSFNPLNWNRREFKSYVLQGGSLNQIEGNFGGVAGGILIGLYAGPRDLHKPMIGTYYFGRLTWNRSVIKISGQLAFSDNGQLLALVGVGSELTVDAVLKAFNVLPSMTAQSVSVAGIKGEIGMYFSVKEFPWFERIVFKGMNPIDAFADLRSYTAAQN